MCVVLKAPRRNIKILEDMDPGEILTPSLECQTSGPNFENVHSSLQFVFGDIERSVSEGESAVKILEDRRGWEGCSDLIVMFYMPSWILLGHDVRIGLYFHPFSPPSLGAKIGPLLEIYSTTLMDTEHLQLVRVLYTPPPIPIGFRSDFFPHFCTLCTPHIFTHFSQIPLGLRSDFARIPVGLFKILF